MSGNPRIQITLTVEQFHRAHRRARQLGLTTSDWLRQVLRHGATETLTARTKQLSVRLDPWHLHQLGELATRSRMSCSKAFALLIEKALENTEATPAAMPPITPEPSPRPPLPASDQEWAQAVLQAAMDTPDKFSERKAFISGVLDELEARYQPSDPAEFRTMVKRLLPELNRQDLILLARADLIPVMDPVLVERSEIRDRIATFHFVNLTRYLPDPWNH